MKPAGPRWLFFRAYLLVALLVLTTGLALEKLLEPQYDEPSQQLERSMMLGSFLYAEQLLETANFSSTNTAEQRISKHLLMHAVLYGLGDFAPLGGRYQSLQGREIVVMFDQKDQAVFYRRMGASKRVLALSLPVLAENTRAQWIVPLFYSLIALSVFLWIRPLSRDLETLHRSALAFGEQDFSTRVAIPSNSWMAPLGAAFNSMAQRIQLLLQSHQELTHAVSHELRTPLARIRFSLEMIQGKDRENLQRHCDSMDYDVTELNTLIEEMLSYAQLNQDNLLAKCGPVAIYPWLTDYMKSYKLGNSPISLQLIEDIDTPDLKKNTVMVDPRLLRRAVDNLISNALRYTRSSIKLRLVLDDEYCQLHVLDDGPGIPEHMREAVLCAYTRIEPDQGEVSRGFGLGLAIVSRIMELHHGEVIIGGTPSGGADMSLRWPR